MAVDMLTLLHCILKGFTFRTANDNPMLRWQVCIKL